MKLPIYYFYRVKNLLTCLIIVLLFKAEASAQDSLILYKELTFSSPFEKEIFDDHFLHKKISLFKLFMAGGSLLKESAIDQAEQRFYNSITASQQSPHKKHERQIKNIYKHIHDTFLTKYEERNTFEEIFYNGYYNCVSATALYGLAFEHLSIPYVIREKPTHVYLIAYPQEERIIVETTSPAGGTLVIDQQFKQNYIASLKNQKLITASQAASTNVNELFDRHYFADEENINLTALAGIQYMNEGLYLLNQKKPLDALYRMEKAYLLYPSERASFLMMNALHEAFQARKEKDLIHATLLARLSRYKKYSITAEMIYGEFSRVINTLLFEKNDQQSLENYYQKFLSALTDAELKKEITFIYNTECGRYHYTATRFNASIPFYEEALTIKPNHQEIINVFVSAIAQASRKKTNREIIDALEAFAQKHTFLSESNVFNELLGTAYLIEFDFQYRQNVPAEAERFRTAFENFARKNKGLSFDGYLVGQAYSAAAVYYFRKGQTSKARSLIATGLEISPGNYELMTRKRMIE